ncbi:MAG: efflux RND transporter periplasmic adaptor subunit [Polyangiaceae bacterium]
MDENKRDEALPPEVKARGRGVPAIVAAGVVGILLLGSVLVWHAEAKTNKVALASSPKPVTVLAAKAMPYRPVHTYVGTLRPWIEAKVGPQFISAYVETVLVRPGAVVKKGQVLATLDCRHATAQTAAISSQAKAIADRQQAISHEAARTQTLLEGGFVSPNDSEQITAKGAAEANELAAQEADLSKSTLEVNDCILRAPFDGEVSLRLVDPGSFVRPSTEMVGLVDRNTVRMTADAPESDFESIPPGTKVTVHVVSTDVDIAASITRRAPDADPGTRTVHFEIDLDDSDRRIPVDTTGEVHVPVGEPVPATSVPLSAVTVNDKKATLYTVDGDVAHNRTLVEIGEVGADIFFRRGLLEPGSLVVVEGRALLKDGDLVVSKLARAEPTGSAGSARQKTRATEESP